MKTNVKSYTDTQLLEKVESIGGVIPNQGKFLIVGVQSEEDTPNLFDDKFYVFDGNKFIMVSSGTTNTGKVGLLNFEKYNPNGVAVWKTNEWYQDLYTRGCHRPSRNGGGMRALIQRKPILHYRDNDKDMFVEEQGELYNEIIYVNMHGIDYNPFSMKKKEIINGWSVGCQVWNKMSDYRQMVNAVWLRNKPVDYALLKEF